MSTNSNVIPVLPSSHSTIQKPEERSTIHKSEVMDHMIMTNDIPENIQNPEPKDEGLDFDPSITLYELEKRYIIKALAHYGGNKKQAAKGLGITRKTLYSKLHKYAVHIKPMKED